MIGTAGTRGASAAPKGDADDSGSSTIVFHSPHPSHRPAHFGAAVAHSTQTKRDDERVLVAAMRRTLRTTTDSHDVGHHLEPSLTHR